MNGETISPTLAPVTTSDEMANLQATVYLAIGCGMIFLIIITVAIIIICRFHMKRRTRTRRRDRRAIPELVVAPWGQLTDGMVYDPSRIFVAFNSRHVRAFSNPPLYDEVMRNSLLQYGPPPPYSSLEDIHVIEGNYAAQNDQVTNEILGEGCQGFHHENPDLPVVPSHPSNSNDCDTSNV